MFCAARVEVVLQTSNISTQWEEDHVKWTAVVVTAALVGDAEFFLREQFLGMADGFRRVITKMDDWSEVSPYPYKEGQQLKRRE